MAKFILDGQTFKTLVTNGCQSLINDIDRINALNVFPVPDGDTGTNMRMTIEGGVKAILALDEAIDDITSRKSIIGSAGNRMDSAYDALVTQSENLTSAKSLITDADIASEASAFTQNQILQQVSTSLLAQANQAPSIALSLV